MGGFWTKRTLKPIRFGVWTTVVAALCVFFLPQDVMEAPRELYFDAMTQAVPAALDDRIVVVDIDRAALAALNGKPWTRAETAKLVTAIAALKPASLAFDLVFSADCDETRTVNLELAGAIGAVPTALGFLVSDRPAPGAGPSLPLVAARNAELPPAGSSTASRRLPSVSRESTGLCRDVPDRRRGCAREAHSTLCDCRGQRPSGAGSRGSSAGHVEGDATHTGREAPAPAGRCRKV